MTRTPKTGLAGPTDIDLEDVAVDAESVLVVMGDEFFVHTLPERGTVLIGRSDTCEVVVDEASLSRRHARLSVAGSSLRLEDLGSTHGSKIGGSALSPNQPAELAVGQAFELGRVTFMVQQRPSRSSRPAADASPMARARQLIESVAAGHINVLLLGETGVGKELTAESIHAKSPRATAPFVKLNCAALAESLLESELFGHERGAFTGASQTKPGLLEAGTGGSVFLDEVGELPMALQAKLLRAVEEGQIRRVGAIEPVAVDVRFISATNRDLEADVRDGRFRQDLYYRLAGASVTIPPLRQRRDEIMPLAELFRDESCRSLGRQPPSFSREAERWLLTHSWPGNVRELRNVVERAVLLAVDGRVEVGHLPGGAESEAKPAGSMREEVRQEVEALERQRIVEALAECAGNQTKAAKMLGMSRRALINRLDAYGIPRPRKGRKKGGD